MPEKITRRSPLWLLVAALAITVAAGLTASAVLAGRVTDWPNSQSAAQSAGNAGTSSSTRAVSALFPNVPPPGSANRNSAAGPPDAFAHWVYNGGTPEVITVPVGTKLPMELWVDAGSHENVSAQQSYITFTNSVLQLVDPLQPGCVPSTTILADTTSFDTTLQNEQCNGPSPCIFRGVPVDPGSFAFASGALSNPGRGGDFRVATATWCASNGGVSRVHWQFFPPAPINRDSAVVDKGSDTVSDPALYADFTVFVNGATATPTNSPTRTPSPTITTTSTRTFTATNTNTPIRTPTPTGQ